LWTHGCDVLLKRGDRASAREEEGGLAGTSVRKRQRTPEPIGARSAHAPIVAGDYLF
jgi:hypothetical protein